VLEGVLELRKEIGLVQELGGLELDEVLSQLLVRQIRDRVEKPERNVRSDDGGRLEYGLLCRRQADRSAPRAAPSRSPAPDRAQRPLQTGHRAPPRDPFVSTSVRTLSLEKERRPLGALDEKGLQALHRRIRAEERRGSSGALAAQAAGRFSAGGSTS
jgi:hypothetical protein